MYPYFMWLNILRLCHLQCFCFYDICVKYVDVSRHYMWVHDPIILAFYRKQIIKIFFLRCISNFIIYYLINIAQKIIIKQFVIFKLTCNLWFVLLLIMQLHFEIDDRTSNCYKWNRTKYIINIFVPRWCIFHWYYHKSNY